MTSCTYDKPWTGTCGQEDCAEHKDAKCKSCGAPATRGCDQTMGPFVCGAHLCDDCEHTIYKEGCNTPLDRKDPENNLKDHCKKGEQKFEPWYTRECPAPSGTR